MAFPVRRQVGELRYSAQFFADRQQTSRDNGSQLILAKTVEGADLLGDVAPGSKLRSRAPTLLPLPGQLGGDDPCSALVRCL